MHSHPLPSQPTPSCTRLSPSSPVFQQTPQESTGPEVSGPEGPTTASTSVATSSASEGDLLADMRPLCIQLGAPKECINAGLRAAKRAHPPHEQLFVPM